MSDDVAFEADEMQELIGDFMVEAEELVSSLDNDLIKLETMPSDPDLLNSIFRAAHTIKGTSSFLGLDQVTTLTHKMEDILNRLRKSEMKVTPEIMDLLLASLDNLKVLLENVQSESPVEVDLVDILKRLDEGLLSQDGGAVDSTVSGGGEETENSAESSVKTSDTKSETAATNQEGPASKEMSSAKDASTDKKHASAQTIRVDVDRLDTLMNLMGEMVLGRNSLAQTINQINVDGHIESHAEQLNQVAASINYITTELQMAIMKMRMQPVSKVFNKFPRLVRDLSRESKKKIELRITGEHTELDRSVIEEIGDPLVHIIRNSCDHGIESPEERKACGKPEQGVVHISADQEGSNIIIKVIDDGKGLDIERIKMKAVERGLVSENEINRMSDKEIFGFIFEAGFSTVEKVTGVSGRGVGMDIVRTNIEKLNGIVEIESTPGKGTTMDIKLPLTLAIIQGLLVESDNDIYILPLSSVHETVKTEHADVSYVNQRPVLRLRDDIIPIINLKAILSEGNDGFVMTEKPYIVVVGLADKKLGIIVDRFLGQEEVVIKTLGNFLGNAQGVAGATILGDGRIRLIVDLIGLFNLARKAR